MDARVVAEDLRFTYRKAERAALDGLSFAVGPGEIFGLLGPNGAGKTTAVKILTTILRPSAGRAIVGGQDVVREPLAARRQLTAVLQESAVETMLSVGDNLLVYGALHGLSRREVSARAGALVEELELGPYLKAKAHSLSGGYKRRLQVAKALMVETPVLFLDEATTGMDPIVRRRVMDAIRAQARAGRTVLLTTQALDEAEALCTRMLLLDRGRALAGGSLAELRALSRKLFRIELAFVEPAAPEPLAELRSLGARSVEEKNGEVHLVVEGREDEWIRAMARVSERWPLAHLQFHGAGLEQIFVELYQR